MRKVDRERLVNSAYLFLKEVGPCSAKKLFKLLYLLDVLHFQRTGTTVTGSVYAAGDFGPYPCPLSQEIGDHHTIDGLITSERSPDTGERDIVKAAPDAAAVFSDAHFSRLQIKLIDILIAQYPAGTTYGLIDVSTVDNGAWMKALQKKKHEDIRFQDTVDASTEAGAAILSQSVFLRGRANRIASVAR